MARSPLRSLPLPLVSHREPGVLGAAPPWPVLPCLLAAVVGPLPAGFAAAGLAAPVAGSEPRAALEGPQAPATLAAQPSSQGEPPPLRPTPIPPQQDKAGSSATPLPRGLRWREDARLAALFRQAGVQGCFVLLDPSRGELIGTDQARALTRLVPASTFKIANSLIGLSVRAVDSVDTVLPYRSDAPPFSPAWEKDMGLREAIVVSNVPIYQELARRIGMGRMQEAIDRLDYGNRELGNQVDSFWLRGPLAISAVEQTRFLDRLARLDLPFPPAAQRAVRAITLVESGRGWRLHAKTGWQNGPNPGVGWWVGWVERQGRPYAFALNLDIRRPADAAARQGIGRAALQLLGLLPATGASVAPASPAPASPRPAGGIGP